MKKAINIMILFFVLCFAETNVGVGEEGKYGHLIGTIYDDFGKRIPGVTVTVKIGDQQAKTAVTLGDGTFVVRFIPDGIYPIVLEQDGETRQVQAFVNVGEWNRVTFVFSLGKEKQRSQTQLEEIMLQITEKETYTFASCSPDGQKLAVRVKSEETNGFDLWILDRHGEKLYALAEQSVMETYPQWSPEGDRILYNTHSEENGWEIWIQPFPLQRGRRQWIGRGMTPVWFRDGRSILFTKYDKNYDAHLYTIDLDDESLEARRLPKDKETEPGQDLYPSYGRINGDEKILFASSKGSGKRGFREIYSMNINGSDRQKHTSLRRMAASPVLSRNSKWIAFWLQGNERELEDAIYLMNTDELPEPQVRIWIKSARNSQWGAHPRTLYFSSWVTGHTQIWKTMLGVHSQEELLNNLSSRDARERQDAVEELGEVGDPEVAGQLIAVLKDTDPEVRWRAAEALGKLGKPEATEALIHALNDEDKKVRQKAANALGILGNQEAIEPLIHTLENEIADENGDEDVIIAAASALGKFGGSIDASEAAARVLEEIARQDNRSVLAREEAVYALAEVGNKETFEIFDDILSNEAAYASEVIQATQAVQRSINSLRVRIQEGSIVDAECEVAIVPVFRGELPVSGTPGTVDKALGGSIYDEMEAGGFKGDYAEIASLPTDGKMPASHVLLVGLGERDKFDPMIANESAYNAMEKIFQMGKFSKIAIVIVEKEGIPLEDMTQAFIDGISNGLRNHPQHRQVELLIVESNPDRLQLIKEVAGAGKHYVLKY